MRITLLEPIGVPNERLDALSAPIRAAGHAFTACDTRTADPAELIARSSGSDAVIIANTPYNADVIRANPALKLIDVAFTGVDHVDLSACRERGVTVCNAAGYSTQTVAELVVALTLGLLRKLPACDARVRAGGVSQGLMGREIHGRTVGVVGTGRIGVATAKLFLAFGARVIAYSRSVSPAAADLGISYVSLPELMSQSDIVTLHTPANPSTRNLIDAAMLSLMKPTALLINCARGPIVDDVALARALADSRIAGAGVDVFDREPPLPADHPLLHAPNTLLSPHVGFLTEEAMARRAQIVFDNLQAWLAGAPRNVC